MSYRLVGFVFWLSSAVHSAEQVPEKLNYFAPDHHTSHFVTDVLQLAISKNPALQNLTLNNINYQYSTESNPIALLDRGVIDIFWDGTSISREQAYEPVRIPLYRGLLGYRVFLTHKDNVSKFKAISETKLKRLVACQGESWPDTRILKHNGYTVATASRFIQLIQLTNKKRCDYFPRAIYEGVNEIEWLADKFPELRLVEDVILSYRFPIYLFVRKEHAAVARELERGLQTAINNGSYNQLFEQHDALKYLYPLAQWSEKVIFTLDNPTLPASAPTQTKYWLQLQDD